MAVYLANSAFALNGAKIRPGELVQLPESEGRRLEDIGYLILRQRDEAAGNGKTANKAIQTAAEPEPAAEPKRTTGPQKKAARSKK